MVKKEVYETLSEDRLEITIGNHTGRLLLIGTGDGILFEKEEVADLIQILKDYYERMD
jgi:hypothetical protein